MTSIFRKSVAVLAICLAVPHLLSGQAADPAAQFNVKVIPPSPEAAALGKYGDYPVSLNNGLVNISIPVYDIKTARLSLPISLSYHAGGVKAYDVASSVGLQWSLNAGGAITRTIMGIPDETPFRGVLSNPFPDLGAAVGEHLPCYLYDLTKPFMGVDGQPDIYNYNLGGSSGKFVFKSSTATTSPWEIVTIPYSPVRISVSADFKTFTIVDVDGTTYTFGKTERTVVLADGSAHSDGPTSWFLTSILSADKSDAINFTYTAPVTITSAQLSNTMSERNDFQNNLASRVSYSQGSSVSTHYSVNIQEITFSNGKVSFEYTAGRTDIANARRLNAIEIFQKTNGVYTRIKRLNFVQDYFTANPGIATQTSQVILFANVQPIDTRLKLLSIQEEAFQNGVSFTKPPYLFEYETGNFPLLGSTAQDFMGFYNGKITNKNLLFYDLGNTTYGPVISPQFGADRSVNPSTIKAGSLKRITYPTGGNTLFELEPNQINYTQSNTDSTYDFFGYSLISHDLANYEVSFTVTSAMTGNKNSKIGQFKIDLSNNMPSQPVISTTVSLFDVTAGSYANFVGDSYPGPGPATYTITSATTILNQIRDVTLILNHTYKLSYGSGLPITNNVLFTAINWQVPTGTTTYSVNKTDYTGGLRIKSITNDDGIGNTTKKKYAYTKWYYNSNLFNGNVLQMADWFKARTRRWFVNPSNPDLGNMFWYNAYGENITFQLGSSSNTVVAYEEVEEFAVDALDKSLGKVVSTFNKAVDNIPSRSPYFRSDEEWKRSQLAHQKIYKTNAVGQFVLIKDISREYDYTMMEAVKGLSASIEEDFRGSILTTTFKECPELLVTNVYNWIDFDQYVYRSNLTSESTIQYDENGLNPTTSLTGHVYGNAKHNLLTRTTTGTSDGKTLVNNIKYPLDYPLSSCDLDICYTNFNNAIAPLIQPKRACELTNYNQYLSFSDPNSAGATTAFNLYMGCLGAYQTQVQTAVTTLNSCKTTYTNCLLTAIGAAATERDKSLLMMQRDNVVNRVVENTSGILENGTEYVTAGGRTDFKTIGFGTTGPETIWGFNSASFITKATFDANPSAYYRKIGNFVSYDNANNVTQKAKDNDVSSSYLWDYNKEYPVAEVINAAVADIAYSSFEADGTGNWTIASVLVNTSDARTGKQSYNLANGSISKSGLTVNKKYTFSFWAKTGASVTLNGTTVAASASPAINGWLYYETSLTGITAATVAGTATIDELRCFPADAQMTTYTYDPLRGVTSQTDANNRTTYFDYDALGRLIIAKDDQGKILKTYKYNYKQ